MIVKIVNKSDNPDPKYQTAGSVGMDICANLENFVVLEPGICQIIPTGIYMEIPEGYECQVRPRSGLAVKYGITVINTPGTVDSDYRGEIKIALINLGAFPHSIHNGDRIAQLVFNKVELITVEKVTELSTTERNEGGFGSTGK